MTPAGKHLTAAALAAALLSGCATNGSRLDRGRVLAAAGAAATKSSRDYFDRVRTARDEAALQLVASDPSCAWTDEIVLWGDLRPRPAGAVAPPLCLPSGTPANPDLGDVVLSLRPINEATLRPTIAMIGALAAYLDAVNGVIEAKVPDVGADLAEAYQQVSQAQGALSTITGSKLNVIPALSEKQQAAITKLVSLIGELAAEQRKAKQLGEVVRAQDVEVQKLITDLREQIGLWGRASLEGDLQLSDQVAVQLGRRLGKGSPADPEARAAVIRKVIAAKRETASVPAVIAAAAGALATMAQAEASLIAAYGANPDWSAAERAKQARLIRQRLLGALDALAGVATAFAI